VREKAHSDYNGNRFKVMDVARFSVVCQNIHQLYLAFEGLLFGNALQAVPGLSLLRVKNKGFGPKFSTGYTMTKMADITINILADVSTDSSLGDEATIKNNMFASEIQFHILPILQKKSSLHSIYEAFRVIEVPDDNHIRTQATPPQCFAFISSSQDIMSKVWSEVTKTGLEGRAEQFNKMIQDSMLQYLHPDSDLYKKVKETNVAWKLREGEGAYETIGTLNPNIGKTTVSKDQIDYETGEAVDSRDRQMDLGHLPPMPLNIILRDWSTLQGQLPFERQPGHSINNAGAFDKFLEAYSVPPRGAPERRKSPRSKPFKQMH